MLGASGCFLFVSESRQNRLKMAPEHKKCWALRCEGARSEDCKSIWRPMCPSFLGIGKFIVSSTGWVFLEQSFWFFAGCGKLVRRNTWKKLSGNSPDELIFFAFHRNLSVYRDIGQNWGVWVAELRLGIRKNVLPKIWHQFNWTMRLNNIWWSVETREKIEWQ